MPAYTRAAHHDRVVAVDPLDLLGREHRGLQPVLA
jgi:ATP-dependent Zn protease